MFSINKFFIFISTLLCFQYTNANFDSAHEIYESGDLENAKIAFEALASIGDRHALFSLGVMVYKGEAFDKDPVKAYALMKIANDNYNDDSFNRVSNAVFKKLDTQQKEKIESLLIELDPIYNITSIHKNILPKPINDEDCEPTPNRISSPKPKYPRGEVRNGRMGITKLEYTISPEGYPRDILVTSSTSYAFSTSSIKALEKFIYEPTNNHQPLYSQQMIMTYHLRQDAKAIEVRTRDIISNLNMLEISANQGDAIAQFKYASHLNTFRYFKEYLEDVDLQYRRANEWLFKSASNGLPNAQFDLGRNMLQGIGCEVDFENGIKWIQAAAVVGFSPAQKLLAQSVMSASDISIEKSIAAFSWLKNAALSDNFSAKLLLAWELSTSGIESIRNGERALELLESENVNYHDELRVLETKAAAHAETGDFKKAIRYQKKALKIAKNNDWKIPLIIRRYNLYKNKKTYRGSYY